MKQVFANCILLTIFVINNNQLLAFSPGDSSAIYFTKEQYDKDVRQISCNCIVKEKQLFLWNAFKYEASLPIRIKPGHDSTYTYSNPDSVYGFIINDIRFRWVASAKKYVAVLLEQGPIILYVADIQKPHYTDGIVVYIDATTGKLKHFTKKHIESDFKDNQVVLQKLKEILAPVHKYSRLTYNHFKECRVSIAGML